ncbi:MAG: sigma-70 family RNA polymerase sigma factor [Oscillospiraceae bacterium]|nr:sigma-70 family RNA polymerase sigma factor [Oscillospiraceae bacterium]
MTNEQLAVFIQQGGNDELIPILWERVRKLLYTLSDGYFKAYGDSLAHYGITPSDLKQEAYSAFLKAVEAFAPDKGYLFTSYLKYPLKNALRSLRTSDLLNKADSLNSPIGDESEGGESELIEFISDSTADTEEQAEQVLMSESIKETVRKAVEELPEEEQELIQERYFNNRTLSDLARQHNVSHETIRQREQRIIKRMRENPSLQRLGADLGYESCRIYSNSLSAYKRTGISNVEYIAIERTDIEREQQERERKLRSLQKQREQLEKEESRLYAEYYSGNITSSQLLEREQELDCRKRELSRQMTQINLLNL